MWLDINATLSNRDAHDDTTTKSVMGVCLTYFQSDFRVPVLYRVTKSTVTEHKTYYYIILRTFRLLLRIQR